MTERTNDPEYESPEDEGIPDDGRPHPKKIPTGDPQEGWLLPGDRPRSEDWGNTAEEQREGESLDRRLGRDREDREPGGRHDSGRLREKGSGLTDHEKDEVATEAPADVEGRSAEEAAVRIEEEPEGLTDGPDRYVEDDEESG
ncbi:MAG TPA: DUF5709 domain-containing protein [Actinomycetota bacterium]|nr:DUF5709 domain-containing protein [Actinomycetota bacterium]